MTDFIGNNNLKFDIKIAGVKVLASEHNKHIGNKPLPAEILITPAHSGGHFGEKCTACVKYDNNPPVPVYKQDDRIQFTVCPDGSIITRGSCPSGSIGNSTVTVTVQDDQTCP